MIFFRFCSLLGYLWSLSLFPSTTSGYFCSELIASAYQRMGILKSEVPSNNFLPSHFADVLSEHLKEGNVDEIVMFKYPQEFVEKE